MVPPSEGEGEEEAMTKAQAEKIVEVLAEDGVEASVREEYSGRCMFGATCVAIICDDPSKRSVSSTHPGISAGSPVTSRRWSGCRSIQ